MRILAYLIFFSVLSVVGFALHYYFWMRLVRDPSWSQPWPQIGQWTLIGFGILVPLTMICYRFIPRSLATPLAWVAYLWMGVAFYLFLATVSTELLRHLADFVLKLSSEPIVDESRRLLLARASAGLAGLTTGAAAIISIRGATDLQVEEVEVRLKKRPKQLEGFSIIQLSDIHVGPILGQSFVKNIVEVTNGLKPDLVAITGDLVDGSVAELKEHVAPLAELKARHGSFFITGNHEYYSGADSWVQEIRRLGINPLQNEHTIIGDAGASFVLAGVNDYTAGRFHPNSKPDVKKALTNIDREKAVVLLAHQPKEIENAAAAGVDLQLSGHTHGGQIWPFGHLVSLVQPYLAGLYRHNEATQIYVNRGTGCWGPPMRLGAPAEITKIILKSG